MSVGRFRVSLLLIALARRPLVFEFRSQIKLASKDRRLNAYVPVSFPISLFLLSIMIHSSIAIETFFVSIGFGEDC